MVFIRRHFTIESFAELLLTLLSGDLVVHVHGACDAVAAARAVTIGDPVVENPGGTKQR